MTDVVLVLNAEGRYLQVAPTNPELLYKPPDEKLLAGPFTMSYPLPRPIIFSIIFRSH